MADVLSLSPEWFAASRTPSVKSLAASAQQTAIESASSATHPPPRVSRSSGRGRYRRIDPSHPGRKRVITLDEWQASGSTRTPDPEIYRYYARNRRWVLKEGVR
jgi:hypothetical protein